MSHDEKVNAFLECINEFEDQSNPNPAILLAHSKYNLNAAWFGDQDAWYDAVSLAGHPFD